MIDNSKNPKLKKVYTDALGNNWYGYVNPLDIDAIRGIAAERAERYRSLMITEAELKLCLDAAVEAAKENDTMKVYSIVYDLRHRSQFISEENSLLDLAGIYHFLENEDPSQLMDSFRLKKQQIWQDDYNCRVFFLIMAINLSDKLQNIPEADLLNFMEKTRTMAERIYRYIQMPSERSINGDNT